MSLPKARDTPTNPETTGECSIVSECYFCGEFLAEHFYEAAAGYWLRTTLAVPLVEPGSVDVATGLPMYGRQRQRAGIRTNQVRYERARLGEWAPGVTKVRGPHSDWFEALVYCPHCERRQTVASPDSYY